MKKGNEWREFERLIDKIQQNSGAESSEEDDYHDQPKSLRKSSIRESKVNSNRNADHRQADSNNLPEYPMYSSAVKQGMIPQILSRSSQPLHTVVEEDEGRREKFITSSENCISVDTVMLKNIVSNALEEQKNKQILVEKRL